MWKRPFQAETEAEQMAGFGKRYKPDERPGMSLSAIQENRSQMKGGKIKSSESMMI
ncbi:hypothetical protein SPHINGOT1_390017 [Sphingomonas sp. T1]|nr:hypothetical protein SPHINGOT1_390017 [Sphingomonas sp. T1]